MIDAVQDPDTELITDSKTDSKRNLKKSAADIIDLDAIKNIKRRAIMELIMLSGMSRKEIATETNLSDAGVHWHLTAIYKEFGVQDRMQLLAKYEVK